MSYGTNWLGQRTQGMWGAYKRIRAKGAATRSSEAHYARQRAYRARGHDIIYRNPRGRRFRKGYDRTGGFYGRYNHRHQAPELKFFDKSSNVNPIAGGQAILGTGSELLIVQGTGQTQRIGRKILVKDFLWNVHIQLPNAVLPTATHDNVRLIVFVDKQCNGATAITQDLWGGGGFQAFRNLSNSSRFRILANRSYSLSSPAGSGRGVTDTLSFGSMAIDDKIYINGLNLPIEYDLTTGAITEIQSNNIGTATMSEHGLCILTSRIRVRFEG